MSCRSHKIRISEIFFSIEGEGPYTGHPTLFVRTFGCNFTCPGFGNRDYAEDPTTLHYRSPEEFQYIAVDEFKSGCDSAYSWHPAFRHLTKDYSIEELVEEITRIVLEKNINPASTILCFTGGEPMLYQEQIGRLVNMLGGFKNLLIETNATIVPSESFYEGIIGSGMSLIWSNSPKLSNSGMSWDRAIVPKAIWAQRGMRYFKFVSDGSEESIEEVNRVLFSYKNSCITLRELQDNTWLMPEGALLNQQNSVQQKVAQACLTHGFKFCARVHIWVWGNSVGT